MIILAEGKQKAIGVYFHGLNMTDIWPYLMGTRANKPNPLTYLSRRSSSAILIQVHLSQGFFKGTWFETWLLCNSLFYIFHNWYSSGWISFLKILFLRWNSSFELWFISKHPNLFIIPRTTLSLTQFQLVETSSILSSKCQFKWNCNPII